MPPPPPCFEISFTLIEIPQNDHRDKAVILSQICWGTVAQGTDVPGPMSKNKEWGVERRRERMSPGGVSGGTQTGKRMDQREK